MYCRWQRYEARYQGAEYRQCREYSCPNYGLPNICILYLQSIV
jgi:hypothetical protein